MYAAPTKISPIITENGIVSIGSCTEGIMILFVQGLRR
jgi:hypothetical protein